MFLYYLACNMLGMFYVAFKNKFFPFLNDLRLFYWTDKSAEIGSDYKSANSTASGTNDLTKMSFLQKFLLMCLITPYLFMLSGRVIFRTGDNWPAESDEVS
jgi:hypothetical protein